MKKTLTIVIIVFLGMVALFNYMVYVEDKNYEKRGQVLISKIEEYREQNNKLPDSVSDLGIIKIIPPDGMGEGPYYEKKDSLNYVVYFSIGFDSAKIYSSETKEWIDKP